jgi:hypothetical protein
MRIVLNVVAFLGMLLGAVWFLQGINILPGSFMTGQIEWSIYGSLLFLASLALRLRANRRKRRNAGQT